MPANFQSGRYRASIISQAFSETKNGHTQFVLRIMPMGRYNFERPAGELDQCPEEEQGIYRVIMEKTVEYFIEDLKSLGFHGTSFSDLDPDNSAHHSFAGMEIDALCTLEEYEGKQRAKWSLARKREDKPIDKKELRKLDSLFGKQLKSAIGSYGKPVTAANGSTVAEADVPF